MIDGPGVSMWLRMLLRYWDAGDGIPAWIPDMWGGAPMWEMVSAFHLAIFMPLARLLGPDAAVKTAMVGAQVVGAWGAYVLARSLWSQTWPSAVAGLIYGLHPFFASHGAMSGFLPSVWVLAATPWLLWSLRKGVRRHGSRYVAMAGLLVGFVVTEQAELAYSIALLCAVVLVLEVARARQSSGPKGVPGVLIRAGAMAAIGLGVAAHWLFPFLSVGSKSFVLMPAEDVRAGLRIFSTGLADNPGAFLSRTAQVSGNMDFERLFGPDFELKGVFASGFYLGWVCVALTLVTVVWLARRSDDDDGTLSAILLASALGIWLTLGMVSLAEGGLADRGRVLGLVVIGAVSGILVGTFLRRLDLGRRTGAIAVAVAVLLFAFPYIAPTLALQRMIPLLQHLRFPRFYPIAALGLALGAAYPTLLVQRWAAERKPSLTPVFTAAVCLAVAGGFLVDVHPYRSYYRLSAPASEDAYRAATARLAVPEDMRVATPYFGDPSSVANMVRSGIVTSVGWPQPEATPNMWRLTAEVLAASPPGFRNGALGLSSTAFVAADQLSKLGAGPRRVTEVALEPNPAVIPMVRAYDQVLVYPDGVLTPELATALASRYVGVVQGGTNVAKEIGAGAHLVTGSDPCAAESFAGREPWVAAEVAIACSLHMWVGAREELDEVGLAGGTGGVFTSPIGGLRGISVWFLGAAGNTELVLRELQSDGTFGRELARAKSTVIDDNGMALFPFDLQEDSAGKRYVFLLSCDGCGDDEPELITTGAPRGPADLVLDGRLDEKRSAAFSLRYDRRMPAAPPSVTLQANRPGPGRWQVAVSGANPSMVVVAESWFPGWKATVDGKDVDVVQADGAFLGVPVPAGDHEVKLQYHRPAAATLGRWVTAITILASLVLLLAPGQPGKRRRRRAR